jgi:hypothetical protein
MEPHARTMAAATPGRPRLTSLALGAAAVAVVAAVILLTLRQPDLPTFAPTAPAPREVGRALVGPVLYTVDATSPDTWRYFSFRLGAVVEDPGAREWDLGFRRYQVIANGGPAFVGAAGILDLGPARFDEVVAVPAAGYQATEGTQEPRHPAIAGWYRYGFFSHVLTPRPHVWAVRTADGRYAKMEIVSYYCPGAQPGCLTFRYVYQGDGSTAVGGGGAAR